uniref:Terminase n=1 Tax=viral metagenome TaxID=1070528 RepID=A0A6M3IW12_9ZZZZ
MNLIIAKTYDPRERLTALYFKDGSCNKYYVRGAVCWPSLIQTFGVRKFEGFAILAGQDINTNVIEIWEEIKFSTIDPIVSREAIVEETGLGQWLNRMWERYYAGSYFWTGLRYEHKRYLLDVVRNKAVNPKPVFIEIRWADDLSSQHIVWKYARSKMLTAPRGTELHKQSQLMQRGDRKALPAVHALECLLEGIERYPYRKPVTTNNVVPYSYQNNEHRNTEGYYGRFAV